MLEREQLIQRVVQPEAERAEGRKGHARPFLIIPADRSNTDRTAPVGAGAVEPGRHSEPPPPLQAPPLQAHSVLQRIPTLHIELSSGRTSVFVGGQTGPVVNGGVHALRLLDAFERPRTVQEVVRVLQGRVREPQGWIGLIEALVRLVEGGVLRDVKQEGRRGLKRLAAEPPPGSSPPGMPPPP